MVLYYLVTALLMFAAFGLLYLAAIRMSRKHIQVLQKIIDTSAEAYFIYDPSDNSLKDLKKNNFQFLGYGANVPADLIEQIKNEVGDLFKVLDADHRGEKEFLADCADGSKLAARLSLASFPFDSETTGYMVTFKDISDEVKKAAQAEQEKMQLVQMEKYAVLRDLGAGVSHEINNPLAIILGRTQTLKTRIARNTYTPQDILDSLEKIEGNVKRISKIVTSMRLMTKDSTNEAAESLSLLAVLEDIQSVWHERLLSKGYDFQILKPDPSVLIFGRRSLLITALFNMMSNSFEATQDFDNRWIKISTEVKSDHVEISVNDSGKGISPEVRKRIFDPFFTSRDQTKSSGLGLSVAKGIIELHKGSITYDEGSTNTRFIISLPLQQSTEKAAA